MCWCDHEVSQCPLVIQNLVAYWNSKGFIISTLIIGESPLNVHIVIELSSVRDIVLS